MIENNDLLSHSENENAMMITPADNEMAGGTLISERESAGMLSEIGDSGETSSLPEQSKLSARREEPVKMAKFQHVRPAFFPSIKEPTLTVNGKIISVNTAAVRLFPDVDYMEILINAEDKQVGFEPSEEMNVHAYKWVKEKDGKRYSVQRSGKPFSVCICEIMGWEFGKKYQIRGRKVPSDRGEEILCFDLEEGDDSFIRRARDKESGKSTMLIDWDGRFGPAYDEGHGSIHIDKFDKFALFSMKKGWVLGAENAQSPEQESVPQQEGENEE